MKDQQSPYLIRSISELHGFWGLPEPKHPLISVFRLPDTTATEKLPEVYMFDFYCISIKKNFDGKLKYGQQYYDFDSGVMSFMAPHQVMSHKQGADSPKEGYSLVFHPTFLAGFALAKSIRQFGFFAYQLSEALHLSDEEETVAGQIMAGINKEYHSQADRFSQNVIIAQIELLLQYGNRYYHRQFITRKIANDELLIRLETFLNRYFDEDEPSQKGLLTVQRISEELHISTNYLSDLLKQLTGQSTRQHLHQQLIRKAQELLSNTGMTAREIAFRLGFEHPQSFNKLFKKKTRLSPLAYRQSLKN